MPLTRWGLIPHTFILTTKGRKTGQLHSTPATLVEEGEQKWLVAPYGPVPWVLNARAAGRVTVSRRGRVHHVSGDRGVGRRGRSGAQGVPPHRRRDEVLLRGDQGSPAAEFAAEAHHHPVFELTPVQ